MAKTSLTTSASSLQMDLNEPVQLQEVEGGRKRHFSLEDKKKEEKVYCQEIGILNKRDKKKS